MNKYLKELFCNHMYKVDKKESTGYIKHEYVWLYNMVIKSKAQLIYETCVVCGKKMVRKHYKEIERKRV